MNNRTYNVVYDDKGRRHWKPLNDSDPEPVKIVKKLIPIDYSKPLEARTDSVSTSKIGKFKIDPNKPDQTKSLGFQCKLCEFTAKDNHTWLDHLNSMEHNRKLGNHMKVEKIDAGAIEEHLKTLNYKKTKKPAPKLEDILKRLEDEPTKRRKIEE